MSRATESCTVLSLDQVWVQGSGGVRGEDEVSVASGVEDGGVPVDAGTGVVQQQGG